MKLSDYQPSASRRILVYGAPKTGKTVLAGQLASHFNLKYVGLENGANSLITGVPKEFHKNIELIQIPDSREFPIAIETCLKLFTGAAGTICNKHGKWNCPLCAKTPEELTAIELNALTNKDILVLDSATQLTNSCISHICKGKADDYKMDYDDWRKLGTILDRVFSQIQQAGYNVIVISHETMTEMVDGKMKIVPVAGTSNFSKTFAKYFDDVVYCEVVNKKHRFASSTGYAMNVISGSRSGVSIESEAVASLLPLFGIPAPAAVAVPATAIKK